MWMKKRGLANWIHQARNNQIISSFSSPKTPRHVETELRINKLKLKPFLEKHLLKSLNPEARKGRLYTMTNKARRVLKLSGLKKGRDKDWELVGWIMASPRQRLVVLKVMDSAKRTSEEVRERALKLNPHLTRISTKGILKDLISNGLIETEMKEGKRYYWITQKGKSTIPHLHLFNYQEYSS